MVKKKLETDEFDFDNDLDFDFGMEMGDSISQESVKKGKRKVVGETLIGATQGAKETLTNPAFIRQTLRQVLPSSYGEIDDAYEAVKQTGSELYDHSIRELKPQMNLIARKLDYFIPESKKRFKELNRKLIEFTDSDRSFSMANKEAQDEQTVTSVLGSIFEQNKNQQEVSDKKEILKDHIEKERFETSTNFISRIALATETQTQYTTNVTQAYQKKMLELTLRGYLLNKDHYQEHLNWMKTTKVQYEAIVKNTSLPEYAKINNWERFKDNLKQRGLEKLYDPSGIFQRGLAGMKSYAKDWISGVAQGLSAGGEGLDAMIQMDEMVKQANEMAAQFGMEGMSKATMAGNNAANMALSFLRDLASPKVSSFIEKNKGFTEKLSLIARHINNPAGLINKIRSGDNWRESVDKYGDLSMKDRGVQFLDFLMGFFTEGGPRGGSYGGSFTTKDLAGAVSGFDRKTHMSINEVIPGYLARIHGEIYHLRTGQEAPIQVYDYNRREFVSNNQMSMRMMDDLAKEVASSPTDYTTGASSRALLGDRYDNLSDVDKYEVKRFMLRLGRTTNTETTVENIRKTEAFQRLPSHLQAAVSESLNEIENSDIKQEKLRRLDKNIMTVRSSLPSLEESLSSIVSSGRASLLAEQSVPFFTPDGKYTRRSLLTRREDGSYIRDEEAFAAFLEQTGIAEGFSPREEDGYVQSDINVKEAIKEMNPKALLESVGQRFRSQINRLSKAVGGRDKSWSPRKALDGLRKTRLFSWKYKAGEGDERHHAGPMAQDVKNNLGEEAAPGGKQLDLASINGATIAAVKELDKRVESMKSPSTDESRDALLQIRDNVMAIKERMEKGILTLGVPLVGLKDIDLSNLNLDKLKELSGTAWDQLKANASGTQAKTRGALGNINLGIKQALMKVEGFMGARASGLKSGIVEHLTANDLLHLRVLQQQYNDGPFKAVAEKIFSKFPQFLTVDTSDEAVEKAKQDPSRGRHLSAEERSIVGIVASMGMEVARRVGSAAGTMFGFSKKLGRGAYTVFKEAVFKPGLNLLNKLFTDTVGTTKNRLTAEDLRLIRQMQRLLKAKNKSMRETAEMYFKQFPQYKDLDTSDKAIQEAEQNDAVAKTEQDSLAMSIAKRITSAVGSAVGGVVDFVTGFVPNTLRSMKNFGVKVLGELGKQINPVRDLYVPGEDKPRVLAVKMNKGLYRNSLDNTPITSIDALMKMKGDLIDENNNVVLTEKELSDGVYDSEGSPVKSSVMTGVSAVVGAAMGVGKRLRKSVEFVKNTASKAFNKLSNKILGQPVDEAIGGSEALKHFRLMVEIQTDIRSILLGEDKEIRQRLGLKGSVSKLLGGFFSGEGGATIDTEAQSVSMPATQAEITNRYGGGQGLTGSGGTFSQLGQSWQGLKDKVTSTGAWNKGKDILSRGKTRLGNTKVGGKASSMFNKLKGSKVGGWAGAALSLGGSLLSGGMGMLGNLAGGGEQQQGEGQQPEVPADAFRSKAKEQAPVQKTVLPVSQREKGDHDGDGDKDGSVSDRRQKIEEYKKAKDKTAAQADLRQRYTGPGILSFLAGQLSGLFDKAVQGIDMITNIGGKVFDKLGGWIKKIPGLGKLGGLIKGKAISVASGAKSLLMGKAALGAGLKTAVAAKLSMASQAAVAAGATIKAGAMTAATTLTQGVGAIGAALVSSPAALVVAGVVAAGALAYGGYKLYKYLTRNKADEYDLIRLNQYGFTMDSSSKDYFHMVLGLEKYLEDGRLLFHENGDVTPEYRKIKPEELAEIFKVEKNDKEHGHRFSRWFKDRFLPFFLLHKKALHKVQKETKVTDIMRLSPEKRLEYLESGVAFESGPYSETISPVKSIEKLSDKKDVPKMLVDTLIKRTSNEKNKNSKGIALPPREKETIKPNDTASKEAETINKTEELKRKEQEKAVRAAALQAQKEATQGVSAIRGYVGQGEDGAGSNGQAPKPTQQTSGAVGEKVVAPEKGIPMAGGAPLEVSDTQYLNVPPDKQIDGMNPAMRKRFMGMVEEYGRKTGKTVRVNDGFRTRAMQEAIFRKYGRPRAAPPGSSMHEFGLAVDIDTIHADAMEKMGLMKKYGFTRPVRGETWHLEPAGIQKNIKQARANPQLATEWILQGFGRGGGGVGTVKGPPLGGRNPQLALQLLNADPYKPKEGEESDYSDLLKPVKPLPEQAAEAQTKQASLSTQLPTEEELKNKQGSSGMPGYENRAGQVGYGDGNASSYGKAATGGNKVSGVENWTTEIENDPAKQSQGPVAQLSGDKADVAKIIREASRKTGVDPNIMLTFAQIESNMKPNAKAKGTTATGLYQFINSTWKETTSKHGSKYGITPATDRRDPMANALMGGEFLKANMKFLQSRGIKPTATNLYLAHFLGPGGASQFLKLNPNQNATKAMPEAAKSNPTIFGNRTVAQVYKLMDDKVTKNARAAGVNLQSSSMPPMGKEQVASSEPLHQVDTSKQGTSFADKEPVPKTENPAQTNGTSMPKPKTVGEALMNDAKGAFGSFMSKIGEMYGSPIENKPKEQEPVKVSVVPPTGTERVRSEQGGVFIQKPVGIQQTTRQEAGQNLAGPSQAAITSILDKSLDVQQSQLEVLKAIRDNTNLEKLAALFAGLTPKKEDLGEERRKADDKNMMRKERVPESALNISRTIV